MYIYSDPSRESDPYALPNVEVFSDWVAECNDCGRYWPDDGSVQGETCECGGRFDRSQEHGETVCWFYAYGFPGCLWDSEPIGPFDTEAEAIADMRENAAD